MTQLKRRGSSAGKSAAAILRGVIWVSFRKANRSKVSHFLVVRELSFAENCRFLLENVEGRRAFWPRLKGNAVGLRENA